MTKIPLFLQGLHEHERRLARQLMHAAERHKADQEMYHLAGDMAGWSRRHLREMAGVAKEHGLDLDPEPAIEASLTAKMREKGSELARQRSEPGLVLLSDLREIYVQASGVSADWVMLAQAAQATKDDKLLTLAQRCHPDTLRQTRWANAKLKESCPQILTS